MLIVFWVYATWKLYSFYCFLLYYCMSLNQLTLKEKNGLQVVNCFNKYLGTLQLKLMPQGVIQIWLLAL